MSQPRNPEELREDLAALIASPGWAYFAAKVRELYGAERVLTDLTRACAAKDTMLDIGAMTVSVVNTAVAIDHMLRIPEEILSQMEVARATSAR